MTRPRRARFAWHLREVLKVNSVVSGWSKGGFRTAFKLATRLKAKMSLTRLSDVSGKIDRQRLQIVREPYRLTNILS